MRKKLENFKQEIRKKQINQYFSNRRSQALQDNHQISISISQQPKNRKRFDADVQLDNQIQFAIVDINYQQKWNEFQNQIKAKLQHSQYPQMLKILKDLRHYLKKINHKGSFSNNKRKQLLDYFLIKTTILWNIVECAIQANNMKINIGLLQQLSKIGLNILDLSISNCPTIFTESIFINSNLLIFLRCCIEEPKFDQQHLSKIFIILVHMILVSTDQTGQLFRILNQKNQKFHFGAIFYNISKIPLRPKDHITVNFIIFMKYYLLQVQKDLLISRQSDKNSQPITCLSSNQIDMTYEISVNSVNSLADIDLDETFQLEEALQVTKILIQCFQVNQKFKFKLNFRKLINLFHLKYCNTQIKSKILSIIDHIIYKDQTGDITKYFIGQCELVTALWKLKDDYYGYVMNIFSNVILNQQIKPCMNPYAHNIFINLKYSKNDVLLYTFVYNWFYSQNFQILESRDKLIIDLLRESQENIPKIIQIQCLLWYHLAKESRVYVPERILQFSNNPAVILIRSEHLDVSQQDL